jgi:hypothetical protein
LKAFPPGQLLLDPVEEQFQGVAPAQDQVDHTSVDRQLVPPCQIEQRFHDVGKAVDGNEVQESGASLERVERAENGVQRFAVVGLAL